MQSPLDSFIASLRGKCEDSLKRKNFIHTSERFSAPEAEMKCELTHQDQGDESPFSSLRAHTHTSGTLSNDVAKMECETKCEGSFTLPEPPLQPCWLISYRDRTGHLRGGCDERDAGTVVTCHWGERGWEIILN